MLYMDHYESKKRDMPVPFADNGMLIRGTALLALGGLLASLATCHIRHNIRTGALAAGISDAEIQLGDPGDEVLQETYIRIPMEFTCMRYAGNSLSGMGYLYEEDVCT